MSKSTGIRNMANLKPSFVLFLEQTCRTADITLVDDDSLMGMTELFPNYPAQLQLDAAAPGGLSLSRQVSEDLFLMPSLPSNLNLRATISDGGRQPSGGYEPMQQQHDYM